MTISKLSLALITILFAIGLLEPGFGQVRYSTNPVVASGWTTTTNAATARTALGVSVAPFDPTISNRYNGTFVGNGSGLTNINQSGVVGLIPALSYLTNAAFNPTTATNYNGTFVGNGSGLTNINQSGVVGLTSALSYLTNAAFNPTIATNYNGTFTGNGAGLTNLIQSNVVGLASSLSYLTNAVQSVSVSDLTNASSWNNLTLRNTTNTGLSGTLNLDSETGDVFVNRGVLRVENPPGQIDQYITVGANGALSGDGSGLGNVRALTANLVPSGVNITNGVLRGITTITSNAGFSGPINMTNPVTGNFVSLTNGTVTVGVTNPSTSWVRIDGSSGIQTFFTNGIVFLTNGVLALGPTNAAAKITLDGVNGSVTNTGNFYGAGFRQTPTGAGIIVNANGNRMSLYSHNSELAYLSGYSFILASSCQLGWSASAASSGVSDSYIERSAIGTMLFSTNLIARGSITANNGFYESGAAGYSAHTNGVVALGANAAAAKITLDGTTGRLALTNGSGYAVMDPASGGGIATSGTLTFGSGATQTGDGPVGQSINSTFNSFSSGQIHRSTLDEVVSFDSDNNGSGVFVVKNGTSAFSGGTTQILVTASSILLKNGVVVRDAITATNGVYEYGTAGYSMHTNGVMALGANAAAAKITLDGTTGGQTNQGALVITNTSQANTFLALAGNQTGSSANVIEYKTNNVSKFSVDNNGNLTAGSLISTVVRSTGNAGWMLADNPVGGIPGLALNSSGRIYWSLGPNWWSTLDLALTRATNATLVVQSNVVAMGTITATNGGVYEYGTAGYSMHTNGVMALGANAAAAKIVLDGVSGNITNGVTSVWNGTTHGVHIANGAIYGSSQTNFAGSFAAARGYIDFVSGNGLAIGGSDGFGQEIKIVPDNRNQTTFSFGNANGTKTFRFLSDSNTFSGSVTATNGFIAPSLTNSPPAMTISGAQLWSDGTNLCVIIKNHATGTLTTNKVTMTAWP